MCKWFSQNFNAAEFGTLKDFWKCERPFLRNRVRSCVTMVGGVGDPNHSVGGQVLVFPLEKSPFFEVLSLPLLQGGFTLKTGFSSKGKLQIWPETKGTQSV